MAEQDKVQMPVETGAVNEEPKKSKRDILRERLSKKYPDKNFDDDEAFADQVNADYDDYDNKIAGYKKSEQALSDMFASDPRSANFLIDWKEGSDPVIALVRNYGSDIVAAVDDPARQEEMAEANKAYIERMNRNKALEEEYKENLNQSLQMMQEAQEQNGWSDEQVDAAWQQLFKIVDDAVMGKFDPETLKLLMNGSNYDKAVATAQQEGEIKGRNAKIEEKLRKQQQSDGTAHLNGKNGRAPRRTADQSIFALASQA